MRFRLLFVFAASLLLASPTFALSATVHHHRAHAGAAVAGCGVVAGHASHTVLANPATVGCRTAIAPQAREVTLATQPVPRHTTIASIARVRFVPPLRGSLESLVRQNQRDEAEGLVRIEDDTQLEQLETSREIVPLPANFSLRVNPELPVNRRYCRPWTAHFLADMARSHYARFRRAFQVNSAVRTVAFQRALLEVNGNAAPADGDIASPHLTGAAVDIGKKGMSFSELSWMRAWLLPLQTAGKIDVEEEFYQSCFHVTVYRSYAPIVQPRSAPPRMIARHRHSSTTLLAAGVH